VLFKEVSVNRSKLIIGGAMVVVLLGLIAGITMMLMRSKASTSQRKPIAELTYCGNDGQDKPCVVSFGSDIDGNMLVNILIPDISFPNFYLKIERSNRHSESVYECFRISSSPNSSYCIGEKMPPGETLHLMIISTKDETILAEGDLTILALALPTLEIVTPTPEPTGDLAAESPAPTEGISTGEPEIILPTLTPLPFPVPTDPSNPTPSYPNPFYP